MNKKRNLLFGCVALAGLTWAAQTAGAVDLTVLQSTDLHGSPAVAKYAKWIAADRMGLRELARSGVPRREVEINLREAVRAYMTKRWPVKGAEVGVRK